MNNEIFKQIQNYNTIVIARHKGADPDALAGQLGLRDAIKLTFPSKKVYAVGASSTKFKYFPKLDKLDNFKDALLIVVDTPDRRRVDINTFDGFKFLIKIDHHPFIEKFCDIELIDDKASSCAELVLSLIKDTDLKMNKQIAQTLFMGIVSDTNRFLFNPSVRMFQLVVDIMKEYDIDINKAYENIFMRPLSEIRLQGYIAQNMFLTKNGLSYISITNETMKQFGVDSGSAGNLINNFNYIEDMLVWVVFSEDVKNNLIRVNIRSRGPVINSIAEKYNGGGHKFASGVKLTDAKNIKKLLFDLDQSCKMYKEEMRLNDEDK